MPLALRLILKVLLTLAIGVASTAHASDYDPNLPPRHGIAMHGAPALAEDFSALPYTDRFATRGGKLVLGEIGTFDTLNPFIIAGTQPEIHLDQSHYIVQRHTFESLMARSVDEPFTLYGLIAEQVRVPADRSWIEFLLNPNAKFADGTPITPEDVIFSLQTFAAHGRPNMRRYYKAVAQMTKTGPHSVLMAFGDDANQETPLIIGLMPVISKAYYENHDFTQTTLDAPLGSGPYVVSQVNPGKSVTFERNPNYWGDNLAINKDRNNFDTIQVQYFRDPGVLFEAFKSGNVHIRIERSAATWETGYNFPAYNKRLVLKEEIPHGRPADMYGLVFNTRRAIFADPRVREALILLFNFEWMNQNFYYSAYTRVQSFFDNSELSSHNRPASPREQELLNDVGAALPATILDHGWTAPRAANDAEIRTNTGQALTLLQDAGWQIDNGTLTHKKTKQPFAFEILLTNREEEKIAQTYAKDLQAIGINVSIRLVDSANFHQRREVYDFDMAPFRWRGTLSPGNEQAFRFGSQEADTDGTFNLAGVKDKTVDRMIAHLTNAVTRDDLVAATRALDRLLLSGNYAIPLFYQPVDRIAYWVDFQHPETPPLMGNQLDVWWRTADN